MIIVSRFNKYWLYRGTLFFNGVEQPKVKYKKNKNSHFIFKFKKGVKGIIEIRTIDNPFWHHEGIIEYKNGKETITYLYIIYSNNSIWWDIYGFETELELLNIKSQYLKSDKDKKRMSNFKYIRSSFT